MNHKTDFILLAALCLAPLAASAATTATLNVSGSVPTIRYIGWSPTPDTTTTSTLDVTSPVLLENASQTFKAPKQLVEVTNDPFHNYTVTISSTNGGKLKHASISNNTISYSLAVSGVSPTGSLATGLSYTVNTSSLKGLNTSSRDVSVTVTGNPDAVAGLYNDTIKFEITPP